METIPKPKTGRKPKYPFDTMKVGDTQDIYDVKMYLVSSAAYQAQKRGLGKFAVRSLYDENDNKYIRIWRTA